MRGDYLRLRFHSTCFPRCFCYPHWRPREKNKGREPQYDLFEVLPDGSVSWRCTVEGREQAMSKLRELAAPTLNELRLMHLPTQTLIARMNEKAE